LSEPRRSGRPRKAKASSPSPAALGVVKVGPDFQAEFPDGNPAAAELYATLLRAGEAINAEVNRTMIASFGVPFALLNSLAVIEGADQLFTPSEISNRTYTSSATTTATIDALERQGWVRRVPNPEDRRSTLIEITSEGQAVADRLLPGIRKLELATLSGLTSAERATMLKLLAKLLRQAAVVAAEPPIELNGRRNRPSRSR
jgi:DNA-binding MarR family transcriptional regulator